ncbi:lipocalin-like domain-containing protein [Sulfitobacter donghicola]|uniref:Iron ABC transporter permease n=1 Tax=Sulfitobacter donghicola DSW-25 = KCTC 12864 = JCM 14565 TaxID=1300350 RepID=A0A073IS17_9RHOB|nr:lipocalin-like domain-containing protein [Sulfitobacter donghicola]KEJ88197.1 iron ABC transporter permease [Sulfitobacter donghicola DSW-25 = KCTC 12864 = JCM 14565]KIN68789.1 Secreted hydrolase [Sulfitobacter donghicola DSW-25 = KCTC 12864 = JCM 14565]
MNAKALWTAAFLLLTSPSLLAAQGFAGMGSDAEGFNTPSPDTALVFPADHGPHPDYRIEWWYLTANMKGPDGTAYGLQWTLFRSALAPFATEGWDSPQIWFGNAAVTTPTNHYTAERFARGGTGQAGVTATPFEAWIDEWHMRGADWGALSLSAAGTAFRYDIQLKAKGPLVLHGDSGYSVKSSQGQASYYYSQPFFDLSGTLDLPEGTIPVTGTAWLDREWSSQPLASDQTGWDWFSLSFESGDKLMGFRLRQADGSYYTSGTWITKAGGATPIPNGRFDATPLETSDVNGVAIPTGWQVVVPDYGVDVSVQASNAQAWMDMAVPYWEGPVRVTGSHDGIGYLEMTGYEQE